MNNYENDGQNYGETIDEGSATEETEGFFSSTKPDSKDATSKKQESKKQQPEKSSTFSSSGSSGRCTCKPVSKLKQRRRGRMMKKEKMKKGKKELAGSTIVRKRGKRRKERRLTNPFIIFYLEMYSKNRSLCVAEVAREAGKIWKNMSAKEKEAYVNKARRSQSTRMLAKSKKKAKKAE